MEAQVEELPGNRVRLAVEVAPGDVEHAVEHAASDLASSVRIPGFRKGKVPRPVLLQRIGKERLYREAVESHIGSWFAAAAAHHRVRPVAQPDYEFELPESDRGAWSFTATVAVQVKPEVPDWTDLEVPRADAEVPDELVEHELDALRRSIAELSPVEARGARAGDTVVLDFVHASGETRSDFVAELGVDMLPPEIEQALEGLEPGATTEVELAAEDGSERAIVAITLKELKEAVLPPLDDELARAGSEFETLEELRADIEEALREQLEDEVEGQFRQAVADALVAASDVDPAPALIEGRTRDLLRALARSVERRGLTLETYLAVTGTPAEQLVDQLRAEARQALARELVLEAVADRLAIEVADDELEEVVREQAEARDEDADELVTRLRGSGVAEELREDLRLRAALDRVASEVKPIPIDVARARDAIWTPEQEKPETPAKLWTPSSKEPA